MNKRFEDVKDKLRVAVESRWEAQKRILEDFPTSHDAGEFEIALNYIGDHLIVFFEIRDEGEKTTEIVTNSDLKFWNLSFNDLWFEVVPTAKIPHFYAKPAGGLYIWQAEENDGDAVGAMLQEKVWRDIESPIYLPTSSRNLTVFAAEAMQRNRLFDLVSGEVIAFPPFLLRHEDGFVNDSNFSLDTKFGAWLAREQHKYMRRIYNEQRTIFTGKHMDFFSAPYEIHETGDGYLFSSITIFEGLDILWLPVVSQVKLRKSSQRFDHPSQEVDFKNIDTPDDDLITLSWSDFVSYFENRLEIVDYYPQRYKFSGFEEADLESLFDNTGQTYQCACRGVTAESEGFGFPCLNEIQVVKIPDLKIRYVPTRVAYREKFDDRGKPLAISDDIPSGNHGRHITVFLEYFDAKYSAYKFVDKKMIERWGASFEALTRSANNDAPSVHYRNAFYEGKDIVWLTHEGSEQNVTSLLKLPNFTVNGDLVMWPVNEKDIYAFGTNTDFMNSKIPKAITETSSFPPFPLMWDEKKEEYVSWLPTRSKPMYDWIVRLQNQYYKLLWDELYELDKVKPSAKSRCEFHTASDGSTFLSTSVAADNDYYHFPQVDQIDVWDSLSSETSSKRIAQFSWDDFMELFGQHVSAIEGDYPVLGLFQGQMQKERLQKSGLPEYRKNVLECGCCGAV